MKSLLMVPAIATLAAALFLGNALTASAGGETTITVHHRLCPTDQPIDDYFTDCHDNLLDQSFEFTVEHSGGSDTFATDADTSDGSITVPAGEVELFGGVPGEFAKTFVYCSQDQVGIDVSATDKGVSFDAPAGDVVCDWFNTPIDLRGDDDEEDEDADGGDAVTTLPNTGVGRGEDDPSTALIALLTGSGAIAFVASMRRRIA